MFLSLPLWNFMLQNNPTSDFPHGYFLSFSQKMNTFEVGVTKSNFQNALNVLSCIQFNSMHLVPLRTIYKDQFKWKMNTQYSITVRYDRGDASKCKKPEDDAPHFQKINIKIKFY